MTIKPRWTVTLSSTPSPRDITPAELGHDSIGDANIAAERAGLPAGWTVSGGTVGHSNGHPHCSIDLLSPPLSREQAEIVASTFHPKILDDILETFSDHTGSEWETSSVSQAPDTTPQTKAKSQRTSGKPPRI